MHQLKVKYMSQEEQALFIELVNATPNNLFDADILKHPTLRVLCSYNSKPVAFLPTQQVLMLESLAVVQGTSPLETGQAFRDLVKGAELLASSLGIKELCFVCRDENVVHIANNHGFEILGDKQEDGSIKPWTTVRMKL